MRTVTLRDYKRRLLRVLVYIQQHLNDRLSLEELAGIACFSPYHFHRIFRGMVGESLKEHVRRLRLERAAGQLKASRTPIIQIALDAGYESHEAFTRSFRALLGASPSQFRLAKGRSGLPMVRSGVHYVRGHGVRDFKTTQLEVHQMKVQIKHLAPIRVAFMRHVGPYSQVGNTWDKFLPVLGKDGLLDGQALLIGLCHDDPEVTPPNRIRYDACLSVDAEFTPDGEVGAQVIPGGDYAMTTHFGPYHKLGQTYRQLLGQWVPRSGRELRSSPCFEVYLNDPQSTDPADLLTDIYAPLEATGIHS